MNFKFSAISIVCLVIGAVAALPIYMQLPEGIRIAPNLYFLTISTCLLGWGIGAVLDAGIRFLMKAWIRRGSAQ